MSGPHTTGPHSTGPGAITTARAYGLDRAAIPKGAALLLVDRLWPRGIRKADLAPDDWIRDVAPSTALRTWFGHRADRWAAFRDRYRTELAANPDAVRRCLDWCRKGPVVLMYGAHDTQHNQAVVLAEFLTDALTGQRAGASSAASRAAGHPQSHSYPAASFA